MKKILNSLMLILIILLMDEDFARAQCAPADEANFRIDKSLAQPYCNDGSIGVKVVNSIYNGNGFYFDFTLYGPDNLNSVKGVFNNVTYSDAEKYFTNLPYGTYKLQVDEHFGIFHFCREYTYINNNYPSCFDFTLTQATDNCSKASIKVDFPSYPYSVYGGVINISSPETGYSNSHTIGNSALTDYTFDYLPQGGNYTVTVSSNISGSCLHCNVSHSVYVPVNPLNTSFDFNAYTTNAIPGCADAGSGSVYIDIAGSAFVSYYDVTLSRLSDSVLVDRHLLSPSNNHVFTNVLPGDYIVGVYEHRTTGCYVPIWKNVTVASPNKSFVKPIATGITANACNNGQVEVALTNSNSGYFNNFWNIPWMYRYNVSLYDDAGSLLFTKVGYDKIIFDNLLWGTYSVFVSGERFDAQACSDNYTLPDIEIALGENVSLHTYYADRDNDGYGDINNSLQNCLQPAGYVTDHSDCDDNNDAIYPDAAGKQVFAYTGTEQTFIVPQNVHEVTVKLWGAGGAGGNYVYNDVGGGGGFTTATLAVNPGEQYTIIVGGAGLNGAGTGAYGGGGAKENGNGGRGGGRSAIRNALSLELFTAGGGGGGGGGNAEDVNGKGIARGGAGGGLNGESKSWIPFNGGPGTQTTGGEGGANPNVEPEDGNLGAFPGEQFYGGMTGQWDNGYNGSGGGGYFGGGSGTDYGDGGGGGGSGYIIPGGGAYIVTNKNMVTGEVDIPANNTDPDYADDAGLGGPKAGAGKAGRVVILWNSTYYRDADGDGYGDINSTTQYCSQPAGYVTNNTDCNGDDATVYPGAVEICDGKDNDCDGLIDDGVQTTYYRDADNDSYGNAGNSVQHCTQPTGYVTNSTDCNDNDASIHPGAPEICDGYDNDCNGIFDDADAALLTTYYLDMDYDGYGDAAFSHQACFAQDNDALYSGDCDNNDRSVYPGAPEICDGKDNDCNGIVDDGVQAIYYMDADTDGYGDAATMIEACSQPTGYVADNTDCDDNDASVYPGAAEICDNKDNNCNGLMDEGILSVFYYRDADNDGYGDSHQQIHTCFPPGGYVVDNTDCDDTNDHIYPGAPEICDGKDNNCNGTIDDGVQTTYYRDTDNDGYGNAGNSFQNCSQPTGYVTNSTDCNDNDAAVYPGAAEICDGKDNDCNALVDENLALTSYYRDADNDGYGNAANSVQNCTQPAGYVTNSIDCYDNDASIHPGATEICDGKDNNCNGLVDDGITYYRDADGDGYGNVTKQKKVCVQPAGYVRDSTDCNDGNAAIHPGAAEICDGKDNDCNGLVDEGVLNTYYRDADGDGYGNVNKPVQKCSQPAGYVIGSTDCNDNNANINPGKTEICGNNIDDNCNSSIDEGCAVITVASQPVSLIEGNIGKSNMTFVISLSAPAIVASQVSYQTAPVTATAGTDYVIISGTLNFSKGQASKTVVVKIIGDTSPEANETFNLELLNPVNLVISQSSAVGTIINDDGPSFAKQTTQNRYSDPKNTGSNKLVIPTLLKRDQIWNIQGLPASNTIVLIDSKGQAVFKATNYKNNTGFSNLAAGLYFYEIMLRDKDGKPELYRGKLMIIP